MIIQPNNTPPSALPSASPSAMPSLYPSTDPSYSLSFSPSMHPSFVSSAGNVNVKYYEFAEQTSLPTEGLKSLIPYAEDYVKNIDFQPGSGTFASSGRENNVAALFEGKLFSQVPTVWKFTNFLLFALLLSL